VIGRTYGAGGSKGSLLALRWAMVAVAAAIAAVLLFRDDYLLGLLIGGLAALRAGYLLAIAHRRSSYQRVPDQGAGASAVREVLSGLVRSEFVVAGEIIGLGPAQVRSAFDQGRSLADMASGAGVPMERIVDAVVSDAHVRIDEYIAEGKVTRERALEVQARLPLWANRLVNFHKGDLRRGAGWS